MYLEDKIDCCSYTHNAVVKFKPLFNLNFTTAEVVSIQSAMITHVFISFSTVQIYLSFIDSFQYMYLVNIMKFCPSSY